MDWGDRRITSCAAPQAAPKAVPRAAPEADPAAEITASAPAANEIEVGNWYAQFFANLARWTAGS